MELVRLPDSKKQQEEFLLFKLNDNYGLVDSLPYVDSYTDELKDEVKSLIQSEMDTFQPHDYIKALPLANTPLLDSIFQDSNGNSSERFQWLWQKEIARLEEDPSSSFQKLDLSRYDANEPENRLDAPSWKSSLKNLKAQIENSNTRLMNLDLILKYAQPTWLKYLGDLEGHEKMLKKTVSEVKLEIEEVTKKRKLDQITGGNQLRNLLREYDDVFDRNLVILPAISNLRKLVSDLERADES